jgi:hypothetical protein
MVSERVPREDAMPDDPKSTDLTLDDLRARIAGAGVTIAENRLAMVHRLLGDALAPLRRVDSRTVRPLEPAVTFDASGPHAGVRQ